MARAVGILSKVRYLFLSSTLLLLYFAFIHPHLLFGLVIWGNSYSTYLVKLQRLQNKAIRIISDSKYRSQITPHFYKLGVLKIADQYTFEVEKMMYQHSKQAIPPCISSFFLLFLLSTVVVPDPQPRKTYILLNSPFHDAKSLSNTKAPKFKKLFHYHNRSKFQ